MSSFRIQSMGLIFALFLFELSIGAQSLPGAPSIAPPYPLATTPTGTQSQALQGLTASQLQTIRSVITPQLQLAISNHTPTANANSRTWQDIIQHGAISSQLASVGPQRSTSVGGSQLEFVSNSGKHMSVPAVAMVGAIPIAANIPKPASTALRPACFRPIPPNPDQDGDGLPDAGDGLETQLAYEFRPVYYISSGEQQ